MWPFRKKPGKIVKIDFDQDLGKVIKYEGDSPPAEEDIERTKQEAWDQQAVGAFYDGRQQPLGEAIDDAIAVALYTGKMVDRLELNSFSLKYLRRYDPDRVVAKTSQRAGSLTWPQGLFFAYIGCGVVFIDVKVDQPNSVVLLSDSREPANIYKVLTCG